MFLFINLSMLKTFIRQGEPFGPDDVLAKREQTLLLGAAWHYRIVL